MALPRLMTSHLNERRNAIAIPTYTTPVTTMRPGALSLTGICLLLACSAEARPFDNIFKSFNILGEQFPFRDYIMAPAGEVSSGVIISDVIGKTQDIAIFSGLTRDIAAVSGRLDDGAQNATVLAPNNGVMRTLKRKPWEDPDDYEKFGASAYDGGDGSDRANKNLADFVQRHIVPASPWKEGEKIQTLAGNEVWWEIKDGQKKVSDRTPVSSLPQWRPSSSTQKQRNVSVPHCTCFYTSQMASYVVHEWIFPSKHPTIGEMAELVMAPG